MDNAMALMSSNIMTLPCEVLVDILTRLSLKHVHQLQTVSKLWFKIISSPHFRKLYNMKSMTRPRARVVQVPDTKFSPSWDMISRTIIISAMDLNIDNSETQEEFSFEDIIAPQHSFIISSNLIIFNHKVCNPTTKEIIDIPISSHHPSISFDATYIPSNNTYKIVHLYGTKPGHDYSFNYGGSHLEFRFETLTLRDGGPIPSSWKALTHQEWFSSKIESTCVNGVVHWLLERGPRMERRIISMDIESEDFLCSIGCPNNPYVEEAPIFENVQLADLNGRLCLAYFSEELFRLDLYFVKDRTNQEWVKEHTINLSGMGSWFKIVGNVQLQGNNGDILIDGKQLILYNIEENRLRSLPRLKMKIHIGLYFDRCFKLESTKLSMQPSVDFLSN